MPRSRYLIETVTRVSADPIYAVIDSHVTDRRLAPVEHATDRQTAEERCAALNEKHLRCRAAAVRRMIRSIPTVR